MDELKRESISKQGMQQQGHTSAVTDTVACCNLLLSWKVQVIIRYQDSSFIFDVMIATFWVY
jgi:hypothetical protein